MARPVVTWAVGAEGWMMWVALLLEERMLSCK